MSRGERPSEPTGASGTAPRALLHGLSAFNSGDKAARDAATAELEEAKDEAQGSEVGHIDALLALLKRQTAAPAAISAEDYARLRSLMGRLAASYPKDFALQLRVANEINALPSQNEDAPAAGLSRARALAAHFPNEAKAHAHLGQLLATTGGDQLQAMRSFVRCLQLDPQNAGCKGMLLQLEGEYQRPRCTGFHQDRFGLYAGYDRAKKGLRATEVQGQKLYLERRPALTGADINEVFDSDTGGAVHTLTVYLTPAAAGKFAALTERLSRSGGYLAIALGGKVVRAPRVMSTIDSGQVALTADHADLKKMCKTWNTPKLPPDLARP